MTSPASRAETWSGRDTVPSSPTPVSPSAPTGRPPWSPRSATHGRPGPGEFKAARLMPAQQAAAASWLLSQPEMAADRALVHLIDTRFFVLARTVDVLLGDRPVGGIDSPGATPELRRTAVALYCASRRSREEEAVEPLPDRGREPPPDQQPLAAARPAAALRRGGRGAVGHRARPRGRLRAGAAAHRRLTCSRGTSGTCPRPSRRATDGAPAAGSDARDPDLGCAYGGADGRARRTVRAHPLAGRRDGRPTGRAAVRRSPGVSAPRRLT